MGDQRPCKPRVRFQRRTGRRTIQCGVERRLIVDITKAVAAVKAAQDAVQALVTVTANNASKAPRDIRGLGNVVKAGDKLTQAIEQLEGARDRTIPPPAKDEKAGDAKKK